MSPFMSEKRGNERILSPQNGELSLVSDSQHWLTGGREELERDGKKEKRQVLHVKGEAAGILALPPLELLIPLLFTNTYYAFTVC